MECPGYDTKSDHELWGMWSTPLFPSLPGQLWPGLVAPDWVLSMGQINLYCVRMLKWIVWNRTVYMYRLIGPDGRVFANCPGDLGSIPGHVISETFKMVLDTSLLNTQQYKVRIKGKVEQSRERSNALPYISVL